MLNVSFSVSYFYSNTQLWETEGTRKNKGAGRAKGEQKQQNHVLLQVFSASFSPYSTWGFVGFGTGFFG